MLLQKIRTMITIIDYGMGNHFSVKKAFNRIGIDVVITNDISIIQKSNKLILPGVGHYSKGMGNIRKLKLDKILYKLIMEDRIPVLGICLGMQLLLKYSEEGKCAGLGLIDLNVKKFNLGDLKVPHIGWNSVLINNDSCLFDGINDDELFYFVHSYFVQNNEKEKEINFGITNYGHSFVSTLSINNIHGVQFHPEKSHDQGLKLLDNFIKF
jgi:imidazole glycerol-phosphate synthase subunit HisH